MKSSMYDVTIVGGGIIGLSVAKQISEIHPDKKIVLLEKEQSIGLHQTGHNSGVIHSGVYYRPGSQKARFCTEGVKLLKDYCLNKGINYFECGKVIVATDVSELEALHTLYSRGKENGVPGMEMIEPARLKEIEPNARGIKALHLPNTAVVDYPLVTSSYAKDFETIGGTILTETRASKIISYSDELVIETNRDDIKTKFLINCAGLYADVIGKMMKTGRDVRIFPFRGDYFVLKPEKRNLVKGLIYPVPNPKYPFLGVHFTRGIDGGVEAGPNAVLSWAREGYSKMSFNVKDALGIMSFRGFLPMLAKTWQLGLVEFRRSLLKNVFVRDLQRLLPAISSDDLLAGGSGIRAQAVDNRGQLLDDFVIHQQDKAIHVVNAPSPGATASLAIGGYIAALAKDNFRF
jgi:L-2-hydroxyglutarate oxidase